jgi:hypothetical protein
MLVLRIDRVNDHRKRSAKEHHADNGSTKLSL